MDFLGRGDEGGGAGVIEDVGEFIGFGGGVDHHEDAAGFEYGPNGDDGFDGVIEADGDAVAAADTGGEQTVGEAIGELVDLGVGEALLAADEGGFSGEAAGGVFEKLVKEHERVLR